MALNVPGSPLPLIYYKSIPGSSRAILSVFHRKKGMAKMELFIGLITLVQNFKIEPVKGREIDLEPTLATVMLPKPQCVRLTPV
ncbi:hypothetical protein COOONC_08185 [Cooperia oncophora]